MNNLKVLILDDERQFSEELAEFFQNTGFEALIANTKAEGLATLKRVAVDLLILDVRLPGANGLDILKEVKASYTGLEVIIVSAHGDMDTVIRAMRLGALDYLRKPFRTMDIQIAIERTEKFLLLQQRIRQMEEKNSLISKSLEEKIDRHLIGVSPQILKVLDLAMKVSEFPDTNVLITGESGTGKENIARIIHFASIRKDNLLCTVNSSSVTDSLMESEFFGHKKGSFTGAVADKKGFFEVCDHGTLFLDEIADMPLNLQAKVLRAIEEKKITRVGDTNQISTDFRIISASNHDLEKLVEEKKFRLDLLHRLNTLHIHIPPLRDRTEDIEPLLYYFNEAFSRKINKPTPRIEKEVVAMLKNYEFPGNVRELKNMIERAVILAHGNSLGVHDFPVKDKSKSYARTNPNRLTLMEQEIEMIRQTLQNLNFNQKATAKQLGISRDTLIRKMKKYNIKIRRNEDPS
ncbi:MAG: sigma-54 dependent transcriptional regulator [Bacteroidales bacterium]|jgi:DNA-binding NtrC family response regulator|nr:sigma-54 dependent transcriptional regulator [Bacteroidales bacterium]